MEKLILKGKRIFNSPQNSVLSAASLIMVMIVVSKLVGFVRQRVLFTYFSPGETDLLLAAFEIPDILFEVFVFGIVATSFIPLFSELTSNGKKDKANKMLSTSMTMVMLIYLIPAIFAFFGGKYFYGFLAGDNLKIALGIEGGYSQEQIAKIVSLSRYLLLSQIFFVVSSFMTGVLESYKRFLVPAIAPLLYGLGIIMGVVFLSDSFGLYSAAVGAVFGAFLHFLIQLPFVNNLGFRLRLSFDYKDENFRKLIKLSLPRVLELSVFQIKRFVWLFLASLVSGGFTYLKSADLLQTLPVGVFGMALAKAALPTLSEYASQNKNEKFKQTFITTLNQILFLVVPISAFLVVLRVPVVRLVFGAEEFDWEATIQTGRILSAFAVGSFSYAGTLLVNRSFYSLKDTKTPVLISIFTVIFNAILAFVLVLGFNSGVWGISLSYALAGILQFALLMYLISKRIKATIFDFLIPFIKIAVSAVGAGFVMFFLIRVLDRSVWVKGLSFVGSLDTPLNVERYVVDTRYTINLLVLTSFVCLVGLVVYVLSLILLKSQEVLTFLSYIKRIINKTGMTKIPEKEKEQVTPLPTETTNS